MFTGIVECTGQITTACGARGGALSVKPRLAWADLASGESIAVNGACLTVTGQRGEIVTFDVIPETARASNLSLLAAGAQVNLERGLRVGDRMGGHYVLGHVDCVGHVCGLGIRGHETEVQVEFPKRWRPFVLPKGSVALNGVSLTVGEVGPARFSVYLIPYTLKETNLAALAKGDSVNIEFDYFGKWVLRLNTPSGAGLDAALREAGFATEDRWNT